ncbi:MAG: ABC transporter ATP-binding protein [Desulfarculus sp.]|nr:ABC transporter ATP-binding protein [Desulfarculus sp.]
MSREILRVAGLTCRFGGLMAVDGLDLTLRAGDLAGLIGPNGAGKTTVFNLLTGRVGATEGAVSFQGQAVLGLKSHQINRLGMGRTFQNIRLFGELSVLSNVLVGFHGRLEASFLSAIFRLPAYRREERRVLARAAELLELVGLQDLARERAGSLAYGQQRLLEIARALATGPSLLLLDEPAAGMNPQETANLAGLVRRLRDDMGLTVLLIEHDMRFVMSLCEHITVLDYGKVIARGTPEEVRGDPAVIQAYLGAGLELGQGEAVHA